MPDASVVVVPEGKCIVSLAFTEKIGLPNYSNVDVGPASMFRIVEDTPEARAKAYETMGIELSEVLSQQRRIVLEAVKAFAKGGGYKDVRNS